MANVAKRFLIMPTVFLAHPRFKQSQICFFALMKSKIPGLPLVFQPVLNAGRNDGAETESGDKRQPVHFYLEKRLYFTRFGSSASGPNRRILSSS